MGNTFIKIKDKYFIWSSVVDAPVSHGMTKERTKIMQEIGECKHFWKGTVEELISGNRAGINECELPADEIYKRYTK